MKKTILNGIAVGAACFAASSVQAYNNVEVFNPAHFPAAVTVKYSGCRSDTFTVPAATPAGAGSAKAGGNRGACLLTTVSAKLNGSNYTITEYSSSGTAVSRFVIRYMGTGKENYKVYSDQQLQNIFDREVANLNSPDGWVKGPSTQPTITRAPGVEECRAGNIKLNKEIDDMFQKLNRERKISPAENKRYEALEQQIIARRKANQQDGIVTLAECNAMTKLFESEKAEIIKMGQ
jgi:hypothetical protein